VAANTSAQIAAFAVDPGTGALRAAGVASLGNEMPQAMVGDAAGRFLWVAASGGGIRAFVIDRATGALAEAAGSPFEVARNIQALAADRASRYLFATRFETRTIDVFAIDSTTVALRAIADASLFTSGPSIAPAGLTPGGRFLFAPVVTPNVVDVAAVDTTSGRLTRTGSPVAVPDVPSCVTVDPAGTFLYVATATFLSSDTLFAYAIDASTGRLTRVAGPALDPAFDAAAANFRPACVTFVPTGRLAYVADRSPRTGASSRGFWAFPAQSSGRLGPSNTGPFTTPGGDPVGLAVDPSGRFAYAIDGRGGAVSAFTIDASTGTLTPVGSPLPVGSFPVGLVVVP
jgi:6-phosphogluconolactonase (cycloisomerase 2 family)